MKLDSKRFNPVKLGYFFIGIVILAFGVRIMGITNFGYAFSDAILIRIEQLFGISVSITSIFFSITVALIACLVEGRKFPKFSCVITSFFLGLFIDFWFILIPNFIVDDILIRVIIFLFGTFFIALGVAIYVQPNYPPVAVDVLLLAIFNRYKKSMFVSTIIMDFMFAIIAVIMFAPIGIGSIIYTFCIGIFINLLYPICKKMYEKSIL